MLRLSVGLLSAVAAAGVCTSPGVCTPPNALYSKVLPVAPRHQWESSGGYCGAVSVQTSAMMFGNWISQSQVRKATTHGEGHGNPTDGYEILPTNIEEAMQKLSLNYNAFDYMQPKPQSPAYKKFLKHNLVRGHPVVWFVMCRGDGNQVPYRGSNPNDGRFSHIEPVWGFLTNHSLDDDTVHDDDYLVHGSDYDQSGYYRPFHTLVDEPSMDGNCRIAQAHVGANEAYPCIYSQVDYGYAVTGNVDPKNATFPAVLKVNNWREPNTVVGETPIEVLGSLSISGLSRGTNYTVYRFNGKENVPRDSDFSRGYEAKYYFTADAVEHSFRDPKSFMSNMAIFYRVTKA